jgi:galactokinase
LEFYPPYRSPGKLKYLAGVESGTGLFINDTIPEAKARELRELPTEFDHLLSPAKTNAFFSEKPIKQFSVKSPGRINLIGEHTDYNGGKVLPFAFDKSVRAKFKVFKDSGLDPINGQSIEGDKTKFIVRSAGHGTELRLSLKDLDHRVLDLAAKGLLGRWPEAPDLRGELVATYGAQINRSWHRYALGALYGWWFHKRMNDMGSFKFQKIPLPSENLTVDINIDSDIPPGSGVSSSAALCLALVMGLERGLETYWAKNKTDSHSTLDQGPFSPLTLDQAALRAMWIEHQFAGTRCGLMDQLAIAKAEAGGFLLIDFGNPSPDGLRFPNCPVFPHEIFNDYQWVLINSMVRHDLGSSPYNERRQSCEEGLESIRQWLQKNALAEPVKQLQPLSLGVLASDQAFLNQLCPDGRQETLAQQLNIKKVISSPTVARRVAHAIMETGRVDRAVSCLKTGDASGLSSVINESHESLSHDYEVSCEEIESLRSEILETVKKVSQNSDSQKGDPHKGVSPLPPFLGSRMTGGGFGGCLIQGVQRRYVDRFCEQISSGKSAYRELTGFVPEILLVKPEQGLVYSED